MMRVEKLDNQMNTAAVKQTAEKVKQELEKQLKELAKPDDTAAAMNQAVGDVIKDEEEKLRQFKMGDAILRYLEQAEKQQKEVTSLIEKASLANAQLVKENEMRNKNLLTVEKMKALLDEGLYIEVKNQHPELFKKMDMNFAQMKAELMKAMVEQQSGQNAKYNLIIVLIFLSAAISIVF